MTCVREFHEAFGLERPDVPTLPEPELVRLRMRLISEEYKEVMADLARLNNARDTQQRLQVLRDLLKELADLRYVVEGAAVSFGLPIEEAYVEVHRSNMSKLGPDGRPIYDDGGKVLKGPSYSPADMAKFVPVIDHDDSL